MAGLTHKFESNFSFLENSFAMLHSLGTSAEYNIYSDPVVSLFKIRQFGERVTEILFDEHALEFPYQNNQHNRLKELEFEHILPNIVKDLLFTIKNKGNKAVHDNTATVNEAKAALHSAFKVAKWMEETYGSTPHIDKIRFKDPPNLDARHALKIVEEQLKETEVKYLKALKERETFGISIEKAKEISEKSQKAAQKIDMSEKETRLLIDAQLRAAGWEADTETFNFKIKGTLPDKKRKLAIAEWKAGNLWADYALFIGKELYGIIEAKKYNQDISTNLRQSKIYAEEIEETNEAKLLGKWESYNVPFLYSTNGRPYLKQIKTKSGIWFLDTRKERNRSRALQGFHSPEGLKKMFEQNIEETEEKLKSESHDFLTGKSGLDLRYYQIDAIEEVENKILHNFEERRALLAMATGTGKTRTIIGLVYRLISSNRFNRILFLVDRTLLGIQAINAFKDNKIKDLNTFSEIYQVDELKDIVPDIDTRLHFATVQGMVKRLFYSDEPNSIPSVDTYDCIIIDEAHRGYLLDKEIDEDDLEFKDQRDYVSKYRMVLEYFDAYAVGLTATPALHTTEIFGKPVYNYSYRKAVIDGFLVDHDPPYIIKTKLSDEGIIWEKGENPKIYDKETNTIKELDELEDELSINIEGFNKMVITENFNRTVIQELIKYLDPESEEKTLIFAATDEHADMVVQILKEEFENAGVDLSDNAIEKITGKAYKPQTLVNRYKNEKFPNIAVTVDLLTTGVDVPKICNLVFLRRIKSRILYEQMMGRATRLCDEIGKDVFQIFDAVKIYETLEDFSNMRPVVPNPKTTFTQLVDEFQHIDKNERAQKQLEQIVAKLQRKKKHIKGKQEENFKHLSQGKDPETLINDILKGDTSQTVDQLIGLSELWKYLDELKGESTVKFYSEHEDELKVTERGYGYGKRKPDDYISGFKTFIEENRNKIAALNIICTNPKELDRKSLKQLKLELDMAGFNSRTLNTAWKEAKNEDIAADIISYIRTMAMDTSLISHEERIKRAVDKVRKQREWTKVQQRWLDRFEKQLIQETVLQVEDLDESPFKADGGYKRLNKIFNNELDSIIENINENLYIEIA